MNILMSEYKLRTLRVAILAAAVAFAALGGDGNCPVAENKGGRENIEWTMYYAFGMTDETLDHHVAFTRGPVLLARESRFADGDLTEPFRHGIKDGQIMPSFAAVRTPSDDIWMAFSATLPIGSHTENPEARNPATVFFCDYASAGNTWTRANFYRTWFPVEYGNNE